MNWSVCNHDNYSWSADKDDYYDHDEWENFQFNKVNVGKNSANSNVLLIVMK